MRKKSWSHITIKVLKGRMTMILSRMTKMVILVTDYILMMDFNHNFRKQQKLQLFSEGWKLMTKLCNMKWMSCKMRRNTTPTFPRLTS